MSIIHDPATWVTSAIDDDGAGADKRTRDYALKMSTDLGKPITTVTYNAGARFASLMITADGKHYEIILDPKATRELSGLLVDAADYCEKQ
jgi:hypothetical protein